MYKPWKETSTHFSLVNTYTQSIINELTVNDRSNVDFTEPLLAVIVFTYEVLHKSWK